MELKVSLAGGVAVQADGVVLVEDRFPGRQGRLLFAYLVLEQSRPVPRDELAEALWGEAPPATWDKALTVLASKLRALLTRFGSGITLTGAFGCYRLDLPEGTWVDVFAAANAVHEAEAALAADQLEKAEAAAMVAASLSGRAFLPGEEGGWVEEKRRELTDVRDRALGCLADTSLGLGNASAAAKWAQDAIALEPFREDGYRRLMEAHAAAGNRAEALRVYERCRQLLAEELGAYPSPETESIYRELLEPSSPEARRATAEAASIAVLDGELESPRAAPRRSTPHRGRVPIAIGGALLLAAAIAVLVVELTGGSGAELASAAANSAAMIDANTNRLLADVPVGHGPTAIAAGPGAVWVTNPQDDSVSRIDPLTRRVVQTIPVGSQPSGIAVAAGAVWAANSLDGTVSRIDPETNTVVQSIAVGVTPTAVAAGRGAVWVTSADERSVTKINAVSGHALYTKPTGALGRGIAIGGGAVWVTDESSRRVLRLDPVSGAIVDTVSVGNGPTGIAFGAGSVWVANSLDGTVSRIDPETNTVTDVIPVGEGPDGVAAESGAVWVSAEFSDRIVRIDPADGQVVEKIPVGNRPKGVAISGDELWFGVQLAGGGHRGGRLVVADPSAPFETIDPAFEGHKALSAVYDSLLDVARLGGSEGTRVVPDLAVSLPLVTAGGTSYAFQLRRGIRYSDGTLVEASDFRRAFERLFRGRHGVAVNLRSLVGVESCKRRPGSCDLRRGIRTNDAAGTIVFHLRRPDAEFQFLLEVLPPVPPGTPDRDVGTRAPPSTGPYMIESYAPGRELKLVRNPHFRVWSQVATPDGFPDEIVFRLGLNGDSAVTAVERGRVGVSLGVPVDRLGEVETRYASQLHLNPAPGTMFFLFLNTRLRPFDDVRVRRAINYAVDRAAVARSQGGPELAKPLCQFRPPSVAGYRPYCPYTLDRNRTGEWKTPDLARARRLVAASGTRGMKVTVWTFPQLEQTARVLVATLKRVGYRTSLKRVAFGSYFTTVLDARTRAQAGMFGWIGASGMAPSYALPLLACNSIRPGPQNQNPSFFCNRRIDAEMRRALRIQSVDAAAAAPLWVKVERELVDQAAWVPLYTPQFVDFVSKRVGNYQYNPASAILLDQLWVR